MDIVIDIPHVFLLSGEAWVFLSALVGLIPLAERISFVTGAALKRSRIVFMGSENGCHMRVSMGKPWKNCDLYGKPPFLSSNGRVCLLNVWVCLKIVYP